MIPCKNYIFGENINKKGVVLKNDVPNIFYNTTSDIMFLDISSNKTVSDLSISIEGCIDKKTTYKNIGVINTSNFKKNNLINDLGIYKINISGLLYIKVNILNINDGDSINIIGRAIELNGFENNQDDTDDGTTSIDVDNYLSSTSENPVQNKIITENFNNFYTKPEIDNKIDELSSVTIEKNVLIPTSYWYKLENSQPFLYQADISIDYDFTENTRISIINDDPVFFANFGLEVGGIEENIVSFYATVVPIGDANILLSLTEGNTKIINGIKTFIEEENINITSDSWISIENSQPFTHQTTIAVNTVLDESSFVGIVNNNPVFFVRHGLMINTIEEQQVTIYTTSPPKEDFSIVLEIYKEAKING